METGGEKVGQYYETMDWIHQNIFADGRILPTKSDSLLLLQPKMISWEGRNCFPQPGLLQLVDWWIQASYFIVYMD